MWELWWQHISWWRSGLLDAKTTPLIALKALIEKGKNRRLKPVSLLPHDGTAQEIKAATLPGPLASKGMRAYSYARHSRKIRFLPPISCTPNPCFYATG